MDGVVVGGLVIFVIIVIVCIILIVVLTIQNSDSSNGDENGNNDSSDEAKAKRTVRKFSAPPQIPRSNIELKSARKTTVPQKKEPTVVPNTSHIRVPMYHINSDSSEESADDTDQEYPFQIDSDTSDFSSEDDSEVGSFERYSDGGRYPIARKRDSRKIVDMVDFHGTVVYLYDDGMISLGDEQSGPKMDQLFVLGKRLGGLNGGRIYVYSVKNHTFALLSAKNTDLGKLDQKITRVGSTLSRSHLAVQTSRSLIVYDTNGMEVERISVFPPYIKRVYGQDLRTYVDVDTISHQTKDHYGRSLGGILDAVVKFEGSIAPLTVERAREYNLKSVKFVQGGVYYLPE